jgi:uncharacterized protein YkwD
MYASPNAQPAQPAPGPASGQQVSGPPGGNADPAGNADPWGPTADPSREDPSANPRPDPRWQEPDSRSEPRPDPQPEPRPAPRADPRPQPAAGKLSADAQALLDSHNRVRAQHCAAPLTWSPRLASAAQAWANSLRAQGCKFGHSGGKYGENLAAGTSGTLDGEAVTAMWYDEHKQYSFRNGGFSMDTGHFTQVVWRGTTQMGCATTSCNNMDIWVCEYDPPGNVETQYRQNVLPTGCR